MIGRSPGKRGFFSKKSIVDRLGELASDIDIYIIPDKSETSDTPRGSARSQERLSLRDALITAVMLAFCTGIGYLFSDLGFSTANVIVIYIIGVLGIAMPHRRTQLQSCRVNTLGPDMQLLFSRNRHFSLFSGPEPY